MTLTATYTLQHPLTVAVEPLGSGSLGVSPFANDGFYDAGSTIQLTATPAAGYSFSGYSGAISGTSNPRSFVVSSPASITATFGGQCSYAISPASLTFSSAGGSGAVAITATPGCGWSIDGSPAWVSIPSGLSGIGSGQVSVAVAANLSASARTATLHVGGKTLIISLSGRAPLTASGLRFVPVTPCRLMETRGEYNFEGRTGTFGPPYVKANETRVLKLSESNVCPQLAAAKAVVANVTLVPRGPVEFVTLWPSGETRPVSYAVRSPDAAIVANSMVVMVGTNGSISFYASHDTEAIVDVSGYFTDDANKSNLVYYPLAPCRLVDTRELYRPQFGPFGPPSLKAGETRRFEVPASPYCAIPQGAVAYSATFTIVPSGPMMFLTVWPSGGARPNVSLINSPLARTLANSVIVPAGTGGSIDVFAYDRTDVLIDINGYSASDDGKNGLFYYPIRQCLAADTTNAAYPAPFGGPAFASGESRTFPIPAAASCDPIPSDAKAYSLTFNVLPGGKPMPFLTAWPAGGPMPNASQVNAFEGQPVANSAFVPAGAGGGINVYTFQPTHLMVEINGYFGR
jgi:hypothetical protein